MSLGCKPSTTFLSKQLLTNHQQIRTRIWTNVRPILGWPRKTLWKMCRKYPEQHKYDWRPYLPNDGQYTTNLLPIHKLAGRDMETGRVIVHTLGGGTVKKFRWVDMFRKANDDGSVKQERVLRITHDPLRSSLIALVADAERSRWILASHGVGVNDIISTYSEIPRIPITKPKPGDAHPIGAYQVGTKVHCIEIEPGEGAKFCLVAGSNAEIIKRSAEEVSVKLPHDDIYRIDAKCMAVAGQLSRPGNVHIQLKCPQRLRWLGKRPRSGQWHRKDGYCGRKIRKPKAINITTKEKQRIEKEKTEKEIFDLSNY